MSRERAGWLIAAKAAAVKALYIRCLSKEEFLLGFE